MGSGVHTTLQIDDPSFLLVQGTRVQLESMSVLLFSPSSVCC